MTGQVLVIGLGNPDRGDDAVGVQVAREVAAERLGVNVLEFDDPSEALDAWEPEDTGTLTDPLTPGGAPGATPSRPASPAGKNPGPKPTMAEKPGPWPSAGSLRLWSIAVSSRRKAWTWLPLAPGASVMNTSKPWDAGSFMTGSGSTPVGGCGAI